MSHYGWMRRVVGRVISLLLFANCLAGFSAPAAALASAPTLVAAGDIACPPGSLPTGDTCEQAGTAALVQSLAPTAVAALGDEQYDSGTSLEFAGAFEPSWGQFKSLIHPAVGNHEYLTTGASGYFGYFGSAAGDPTKGYYSYDLGDWHLISLNSNCEYVSCAAGGPQGRWLRADLASHSAPCTLAYWHHPLFTSGLAEGQSDGLATRPLWQALYDNHADVVLNGHDHDYERFAPQGPTGQRDPNGIREFVVGTGGKSHFPISTTSANSEIHDTGSFGVLLLTLSAASYEWRFVPETPGGFTDHGTAECHSSGQQPVSVSPPLSPNDTTAPSVLSLGFLNASFRAASHGGSIARKKRPVGTRVRYRLSEAATARYTIERRAKGRKKGHRCVAPTRKNRRARRCTRYVRLKGGFSRTSKAGLNSFRFTGRLRGKKLRPGRYRLVMVAVDAAKNKSTPRRAKFRIVLR
jgi:hypothetical protein